MVKSSGGVGRGGFECDTGNGSSSVSMKHRIMKKEIETVMDIDEGHFPLSQFRNG